MLLMIDNYDSFTYNLVSAFQELGQQVAVYRNDMITVKDIQKIQPQYIVFSPGPCSPTEAGIAKDIVTAFLGKIPMLGVCLGHQIIGAALGAQIIRAPEPVHGIQDKIICSVDPIFTGVSTPLLAARYHSLIVSENNLPQEIKVLAHSEQGLIMALKHTNYVCYGFQFHPESILTPQGKHLLANFLEEGKI